MKRNRSDARTVAGGDARAVSSAASPRATTRRRVIACALAVFAVAFGVRLLTWAETREEVGKVQTTVTAGYKRDARYLNEDGFASLFSRRAPLAQADSLGHPPGYPLALAALFSLFGESDAVTQFFGVACDALSVAVLFLVVAELLGLPTALVAALCAALSPQLAWNSVLLLPDSLAVLPILCAIYCITRATRSNSTARPLAAPSHASRAAGSRVALLFVAGALVGVSCWLRANALLLAPFLAVFVFFLAARAERLRLAVSLVAGAALVVGALTVRNAVVFRAFVPVSLGAGQTLLEGIGDYDAARRFGTPATDDEIMRQEADAAHRPDYRDALLGADGISRERARLQRGFAVIGAHPFWFASVMLRRAASMLRLERARRVRDATIIGALQRLFVTAVFLPFVLAGILLLARSRRRRALALLCVVPAYYMCVQSAFHTEYRYTLALTYFTFALAAVALNAALSMLRRQQHAERS